MTAIDIPFEPCDAIERTGADGATNPASAIRTAGDGVRDIIPIVIGVAPFGLAIGASIGTSGLSLAQGIFSGPGISAGAAQLTTVQMLDAGAAPLVIVLSALMINARLLIYSASMAPWFATEPVRRRLLLAMPLIDQLYFLALPRFESGDLDARERRWYYVGAASFLVGAWTLAQFVGIVGGNQLPDWLGLKIAAPLALAGLLAKSVTGRRATVSAVIAAGIALVAAGLPFRSSVLVATLVALAVGSATPVRVEISEAVSS